MNTTETTVEAPLVFTDSAARKVKNLIAEEGDDSLNLRVFISGGGCSGNQYGMTLENEVRPSDFIFEQHGVKLVMDDVSIDYMRGSVIDYVEDVMGSGFKIDNPQATATCGCGHSFQTGSGPSAESGSPAAGGGCC